MNSKIEAFALPKMALNGLIRKSRVRAICGFFMLPIAYFSVAHAADINDATRSARAFSAQAASSTLAQRIGAASTAAATNPACHVISDGSTGADGFYWEIDDQNGIVTDSASGLVAAGSINPPGVSAPKYQRATSMPIASASKWLYGAYVAETVAVQNNGVWQIAPAYVPFLNFTSGYADMQDACSAAATGIANPTVQDCLNQPGTIPGTTNATLVAPLQGVFYYNSGHFEVFQAGAAASIAGVMNGAKDTNSILASKLTQAFAAKNVQMSLIYYTPILAGGVYTTPADYAAFLQGLIRPANALIMASLLNPSASDPYAVCTNSVDPTCTTAKYSPLQGEASFHYSIGHWIEDDPLAGDGAYSSAGAYGFYPWVNVSKTYAGLVARSDTSHSSTDLGPGFKSQQCGLAIRSAFFNGVVQSASTTTLAASSNPSLSNQAITLTATIRGNAPTGVVTFSTANTQLCAQVAVRPVGNGAQANCVTSLSADQTITAKYSGDANNTPSQSDSLSQTVTPAPAFNPDQFGLTGAWYDPITTGQGLVLEVYPDSIGPGSGQFFGGLFTYSSDGTGTRVWYTLQGAVQSASTTAQVGIYAQKESGNFNAGPVIPAGVVGSATIAFGDCGHMTLTYTFSDGSGRTGTIPLTRITVNSSCSASGDSGAGNDPRELLSGAWYNPATSGQGMVFDISPSQNVLAAAWYTYAPIPGSTTGATQETWYTIQSTAFTTGLTAIDNVPIYTASGGAFNQPTPVTTTQVGTANIAFGADCRSMTLQYTFTGGDNAGQSGSIDMLSLGLVNLPCALH